MIIFETIRWKNLLSTGNYFTEIQLNRSNNTLIVGTNGAGKSTLLDALCFVLFGKPFRSINKPGLINSINGRDCVVEIEFKIGDREYKVIRGIKPNIFEIYCNGIMVNQDAKVKDYQEHLEKLILKLNYKSFTQVVILGSASFTPFMQLAPKDRRTIIEDLLDIEIFSVMNTLVKQKLASFKDETISINNKMEILAEKIKLQKENIEQHKQNNQVEIEKKLTEIANNESYLAETNELIRKTTEDMEQLAKDLVNEKPTQEKSSKLVLLEDQMKTRYKKIDKEMSFYNENDDCPTCKQQLDKEFKHLQVLSLGSTKLEIEDGLTKIKQEIKKVSSELELISSVKSKMSELTLANAKYSTNLQSVINYIGKLRQEISELETKKNAMEHDNDHLKELKTDLANAIEKKKALLEEKHYYDFASSLLKDTGIKTRIIKQYLPIMNKLINKYLSNMNFFVNFEIDENFEETIKSRYRDDFSYYNFSEGEKFRIDVALLLTWRQIARLKNSVNTNLLILDEVFDSSLDTGGMDEFMKLLYDLGLDTNVFVISHKGDQLFDKFRSVIKFEKRGNFSQIAK